MIGQRGADDHLVIHHQDLLFTHERIQSVRFYAERERRAGRVPIPANE
jgi:hypothetical protein